MAHKWPRKQKRQMVATRKQNGLRQSALKDLTIDAQTPQQTTIATELQSRYDLNQRAEFNYRRGLLSALECILRELR